MSAKYRLAVTSLSGISSDLSNQRAPADLVLIILIRNMNLIATRSGQKTRKTHQDNYENDFMLNSICMHQSSH